MERFEKSRIEYIDSMRGVAMLMVIIYHVSFGCFHSDNIITKVINVQLELPLFFFISGFFAEHMSAKGFRKAIIDKLTHLVIPALLVMLLFCWVMDIDFIGGLQKRLKEGYWFTLVLFEFVVVYLITDLLGKSLRLDTRWKRVLHLFCGIAFIYIASFSEKYNVKYPIINMFTIGEFSHYIFFVVGSILFPNRDKFCRFLNNKYLFGVAIILYIVADVFRYKYGFAMFRLAAMVSVSILIMLGLLIIWGLFIRYKSLSNGNIYSRFFNIIGRRSLDVYFIHYFILPQNMDFVGSFFRDLNIPFIEYCLAIGVAILLTLFSLGIGSIIRLSPFIARWLLGVKE